MKKYLKTVFSIPKSVCNRPKSVAFVRKIWADYGYYISLACLLALFGTTAYLYRSGRIFESRTVQPVETHSIAAMAYSVADPEPTPAPTPYAPSFIVPVDGEITAAFSPDELTWNDELGIWSVHNGIDIAAAHGTAVLASESGTVSALYNDAQFGNVIEITHEDGWLTRYCSLGTLNLLEAGMHVEQGDIISSVGSGAIADHTAEPHLHFEIMKDNIYQEPGF